MQQQRTVAEVLAICLDEGSELQWQELVCLLQPVIASVVLRAVRRGNQSYGAIADDLVQESFVKLFREDRLVLRRFVHRHESALLGFVRVVASSVVNDYFRKLNTQKRAGEYAIDPEDLGQIAVARGSSALDVVLMKDVERCVNDVARDERDRKIFWLYYRQGFTAADIAGVPGIDLLPKGVESCLLRMVKAVRQKMTGFPASQKGPPPSSALGEMR